MRSRSLTHLVALGLTALLAVGLVGSVAMRGSTELEALDDEHEQALVALDGLTVAAVHQAETALLFMGLLAENSVDATLLNATLDDANQLAIASKDAWARFAKASLELPGEGELRTTFETGLAAGTASGTEIASVVFGALTQGDVSPEALQTRLEAVRAMSMSSQGLVATLDTLIEMYQSEIDASVVSSGAIESSTADNLLRTTVASAIVFAAAWVLAMRSSLRRGRIVAVERHERELEAGRNELDARLQRGLVMAADEQSCLEVVGLALRELDLESTEVLVADSSRAHFHQVISPTGDASQGCSVATPNDCPAARTGQTQTFARSESIDACPHLRDHPKVPCSAVCAPINIAGVAVGVMSATGADGALASANAIANLELVARKTGERLGALRTFSKSEIQASTDALTGLLNRRSVEAEAGSVVDKGGRYAVAFGDLDHFKRLNDVYGHDTGDRALRLFSRVLRDSVRPQDIPARYGGEEFVIVLPGCSAADAVNVVERVRQRLAEALEGGSTPPFTASFGVASDDSGLPFADLVSIADAALLTAKAEGRNRTIVGGASAPAPEPAPSVAAVPDVA
jgi:diguanylate cyclase (GGDEF)-like protein